MDKYDYGDDNYTRKLLDFVKKHRVLYDIHYYHKNPSLRVSELHQMRKTLWESFAKETNMSVAACKKKWKHFRDTYKRILRKENDGYLINTSRFYQKFKNQLNFLDEVHRNNKKGPRVRPSLEQFKPVTCDQILRILEVRLKHSGTNSSRIKENNKEGIKTITTLDSLAIDGKIHENMIAFKVSKRVESDSDQKTSLLKLSLDEVKEYVGASDDVKHKKTKKCKKGKNMGVSSNVNHEGSASRSLPEQTPFASSISQQTNKEIENQFKDTEHILKSETGREKMDRRESSQQESGFFSADIGTEKFFQEMGEYVENRFPEDKQLDLKNKIWSLLMAIDISSNNQSETNST